MVGVPRRSGLHEESGGSGHGDRHQYVASQEADASSDGGDIVNRRTTPDWTDFKMWLLEMRDALWFHRWQVVQGVLLFVFVYAVFTLCLVLGGR